jgi:tetraacyldisaccharide 4'-kinase
LKGSGVRPASLWYGSHPLSILLLPLSGVFGLLVSLRRFAYETGMLRRHKLPVPVIVIGNITVGGTGKTPLVIWLVESLRGAGYRPGVVSRGYGGDTARMPQLVTADSDPVAVGDEPVLIAQRAACPVAVAPRRVMAARALIADHDCNVIVSDDGLQHYALERDMEIAVIDGERRLGNGHYLPAGPLREQATRLRRVDIMVVNGKALPGECRMQLVGTTTQSLVDAHVKRDLGEWRDARVHAVAGIGNPARFFDQLRGQGLKVVEHPFPDHHRFRAADLRFGDDLPVVMTEKDAVKCRAFAAPNHWYVPVSARFDADCQRRLQHLLAKIKPHESTG